MKGAGMLVGNFELHPKSRPIWAWPKHTMLKHRQVKNTVTFNDGKDIVIEYFYPQVVFKSIVIN